MKTSLFAAGVATALLGFAGLTTSAQAAIIGATPNADLLDSPFTFTFGDSNQASYTFSADSSGFEPINVSTGGSALVFSLGFPFNDTPQPTSYRENASLNENTLALRTAFPEPATVPFTFGGTFVGLQFTLDDGVHFGYADVGSFQGSTLFSFAYESEPGVGILTGASIDQPINTVPEPSALALLGLGLVGLIFTGRRRQQSALKPTLEAA